MLSAARLCRLPVTSLVTGTLNRAPKIVTKPVKCTCLIVRSENYASQARTRMGFRKKAEVTKSGTTSLTEKIMAPAGETGKATVFSLTPDNVSGGNLKFEKLWDQLFKE